MAISLPDRLTTALGRPPERIAVFRALKLGDLLCAVPAFRALRRAFPRAKIALIGLPWASDFVARFGEYFDEFIPFPGYPGLPEQPVDPPKTVQFLVAMQARRFDAVLQMQGNGSLVNALLGLFGAETLAGYFSPSHPEQFCPDPRLFMPYPAAGHEVERHVRLMEFLGLEVQGYDLEFPLSAADQHRAEALPDWPKLAAGPFAVLHPGGVSARRWPPAQFAEVADVLAERGLTVVLTGVSAEKETVEDVRQRVRHPALSLVGQTDLGSLGYVLSRAALLVSNDTGTSHVAAARRVPSVVIYTTSKPAEWAPLDRARHRAVLESEATAERVLGEIGELLRLEATPSRPVIASGGDQC